MSSVSMPEVIRASILNEFSRLLTSATISGRTMSLR